MKQKTKSLAITAAIGAGLVLLAKKTLRSLALDQSMRTKPTSLHESMV